MNLGQSRSKNFIQATRIVLSGLMVRQDTIDDIRSNPVVKGELQEAALCVSGRMVSQLNAGQRYHYSKL